jgi:hypothetical protein
MDIVERLRDDFAIGYETRLEAADEIERLRRLVKVLLDNDPNDMAADAVTVLMVWREEARAALKEGE